MNKLIIALTLMILNVSGLWGTPLLSFHDLGTLNTQEEILIRGFPYVTTEGKVILSSEPNMKSCCVGASHKVDSQILLEEYPANDVVHGFAIMVQGRFKKTDEQIFPKYHLANARKVEAIHQQQFSSFSAMFGVCGYICHMANK